MEAKRIYDKQSVANMIAGKLTKNTGQKYEVLPVTRGFQVCCVTVCPPKTFTAPTAATANEHVITIEVVLLRDTDKYLAFPVDGKTRWLGKSSIISYAVSGDKAEITLDRRVLVRNKMEALAA